MKPEKKQTHSSHNSPRLRRLLPLSLALGVFLLCLAPSWVQKAGAESFGGFAVEVGTGEFDVSTWQSAQDNATPDLPLEEAPPPVVEEPIPQVAEEPSQVYYEEPSPQAQIEVPQPQEQAPLSFGQSFDWGDGATQAPYPAVQEPYPAVQEPYSAVQESIVQHPLEQEVTVAYRNPEVDGFTWQGTMEVGNPAAQAAGSQPTPTGTPALPPITQSQPTPSPLPPLVRFSPVQGRRGYLQVEADCQVLVLSYRLKGKEVPFRWKGSLLLPAGKVPKAPFTLEVAVLADGRQVLATRIAFS